MSSCKKESSPTLRRKRKFNAIRNSMKLMPCMRRVSDDLQKKLQLDKLRAEDLQGSSYSELLLSPSFSRLSVCEQSKDQSFFDNFQLQEKIGEGCNATVYKGIYKPTGKFYAIKKMKIDQEHILALKKDFIILKQLNHPSICLVKALYIMKQFRTAYLIMEYLPFSNLEEECPKSEEQLRNIVRQLLEALGYLHSRNICHRDVKPQNILFDKENQKVKLIDFGVSKKTFRKGKRREMLTVIGTQLYMAPEVFSGGGYDQKTDLWALGVTIYKLVTGRTPFESEYRAQTVKNIQKGVVNFDQEQWNKYSPNLQNLVIFLLEKVQKRISIPDALRHIWMHEAQSKKRKVRRLSSVVIDLNQTLHEQMLRESNASSKEEGYPVQQKVLLKSIDTLASNTFDLVDSDNQKITVSPKTTPQLQKNNENQQNKENNEFIKPTQTKRFRSFC